jgi:hypothetical protein
MLHFADVRELQSDLNSLIVLGQEYTANPYAPFPLVLSFLDHRLLFLGEPTPLSVKLGGEPIVVEVVERG